MGFLVSDSLEGKCFLHRGEVLNFQETPTQDSSYYNRVATRVIVWCTPAVSIHRYHWEIDSGSLETKFSFKFF